MKFRTLTGRPKDLSIHDWLIDWEGDSLSQFQADCKDFFYPYWKNDIVCEEFRIGVGRMSIDLFNVTKRIAAEIQGSQHSKYNAFLSGSRAGYLGQLKRDMKKAKWCEVNGITLIEIHPHNMPLTKEWVEETFKITL